VSVNIDFRRFDKETKAPGFVFESNGDLNNLKHDFDNVSMNRLGFNVHTNIQNYTNEAVYMGGSLRTKPTRINSLRRDGGRPLDQDNNSVVITICSSVITNSTDPKKKIIHHRKTEVRIPANLLNQGSVFIDELDMYIMAESQIDATRELIARDLGSQDWDDINIPESMSKLEPAVAYGEYKDLIRQCIERQDKMQVRIGVDLRYDLVPDIINTMRIAVLDSYFVPSTSYKLVFDPTLTPDEFVIENLHASSRETYLGSFSELQNRGTIYLDHGVRDTLFGKFYGIALFANKAQHVTYVHERKSQERFSDETLFVANRSGDPRLREELTRTKAELNSTKTQRDEADETVANLRKEVARLRGEVGDRERTIERIRSHHDGRMSAEVVLKGLENDSAKLGNDSRKIDNERVDIVRQEKMGVMSHKATIFKYISEMMKSGWVIVTGCIGGVLSIIALCKKYNIKLTMSA
jgi:hypothetical protein